MYLLRKNTCGTEIIKIVSDKMRNGNLLHIELRMSES